VKYSIKYLPDAALDRDDIKKYLSQFYEDTVGRFFSALKQSTDRLKEWPYSCPAYSDDPDYRMLVVGDYLVFYMVNEDLKVVEIHRIFHGKVDIKQHLNSHEESTQE